MLISQEGCRFRWGGCIGALPLPNGLTGLLYIRLLPFSNFSGWVLENFGGGAHPPRKSAPDAHLNLSNSEILYI
jgi:hypothetical protein